MPFGQQKKCQVRALTDNLPGFISPNIGFINPEIRPAADKNLRRIFPGEWFVECRIS
jgi:hypothetical protein